MSSLLNGLFRLRQLQSSRFLAVLLLSSLLAACATRPAAVDGAELLSGRLSVRIAADAQSKERSLTVAFELTGNPQAGRIDFSTPLGSVLARARWSPQQVLLITDQGERQFADLDSMSREALGEVVPVAALFDWLRGRPWPGAASQPAADGKGFSQLGWQVDVSQLANSLISARRDKAPVVTVKAVIDQP